jgi:hypothetical protein
MTGRVAARREEANARSDFRVILDQLPILPRWKYRGNALAGRSAALGQFLHPTRIRPPIVFDGVDDQFGIREGGRVDAWFGADAGEASRTCPTSTGRSVVGMTPRRRKCAEPHTPDLCLSLDDFGSRSEFPNWPFDADRIGPSHGEAAGAPLSPPLT